MNLGIKDEGQWVLQIKIPEHVIQEVAQFEFDTELTSQEVMWVMVKLSEDYEIANGATWDEISDAIWDEISDAIWTEVDRVRPEAFQNMK